MCCCEKPTINGQPGYRWQPSHPPSVRPVAPPDTGEGDTILFDEPGRCGGVDSHSHHYRVVRHYSSLYLLVRHGGGDERIPLSLYGKQPEILGTLDSNTRYWLFNAIYRAHSDGADKAREAESLRWRRAAAEKRIKTRKLPAQGMVKVWIEPQSETRTESRFKNDE